MKIIIGLVVVIAICSLFARALGWVASTGWEKLMDAIYGSSRGV